MRSSDPAALKALDDKFQARSKQAVEEENQRWNNRGAVIGVGGTGRRAAGGPDAEGQRDRADRDGGLARAADPGSAAAKAPPIPTCR